MYETYEKIGDIVYPVTYFDNGIVIVDYPRQVIKKLTEAERARAAEVFKSITKIIDETKSGGNNKES